jgi:hypothetical protein
MKKSISWFIAVLITLSVAVFQFIMGSTYPLVTEVNTGKQRIQCELRRSYSGNSDCPVVLPIRDITVSGYILYRIYPSENTMTRIDFNREGDRLKANLPKQPPSGKLEYRVFLIKEGTIIEVNEGKPVVIRFLGTVPLYILILQSLLIFLAILYSTLAGLFGCFGIKINQWRIYFIITLLLGVVFLLQPLMHKFTLNQWWTGIPVSLEPGDNKLLMALIVWVVAACLNLKKIRPGIVILASIISLILFSVPHSFPGSGLEPVTIEVFMKNFLPLVKLF